MLVKDATKQQAQKICNYMYEKYGEIDENNIPTAEQNDICKHCPFSTISLDGCDEEHYHCFSSKLFYKIDDEELLNYLNIQNQRS